MSAPDATDRDTADVEALAEEPSEVGWYAYSGGAQSMIFHLRETGQWSAYFDNGTAGDCAWGYIEQALGVWDLVPLASDRATAKAEALREAAEHFRGLHTGADMQSDQGRRVYVDSLQMGKFLDWLDGHAAARIARTP